MPPAKKQKSSRDSAISTQDADSDIADSAIESVRPGQNDKSDDKQSANEPEELPEPGPHDYICIHRPFFDYEGENWLAWSTDPSAHLSREDLIDKRHKPNWEQEKKDGIFRSPPEKHPEHKWVIMWDAFMREDLLDRKAKYCDPDNFGMYIYNDWKSWGMLEVAQNMMIEFDKAYKSKEPTRLEEMWVVVSAIGYWLNEDKHINELISGESADVLQIIYLIGCALLTVLAAVERAGELKPDSRFLDLTLVISYYLEMSYDLPAYGVEGECVAWRKEAIKYFKKGHLDPAKGLSTTKARIEKLEKMSNYDEKGEETKEEVNPVVAAIKQDPIDAIKPIPASPASVNGKRKRDSDGVESSKGGHGRKEEDPWKWVKTFRLYKKEHRGAMGGQHYDITKMTRAERASAAFNHKDPLADIPAKELRQNLIDVE